MRSVFVPNFEGCLWDLVKGHKQNAQVNFDEQVDKFFTCQRGWACLDELSIENCLRVSRHVCHLAAIVPRLQRCSVEILSEIYCFAVEPWSEIRRYNKIQLMSH